jgi:CheY-like chemotaxis protein
MFTKSSLLVQPKENIVNVPAVNLRKDGSSISVDVRTTSIPFHARGCRLSSEAAIRLYAEVLPDVILMDMVMQGMDGASATPAIRHKFP